MVVERLFKERWVERRPLYSFFLGIMFSLIAFFTARFLFQGPNTIHMVGITAILFTIILALPGVNNLFNTEEQREAKGKQGFFKEHEGLFDFFLYFFLGVFIVFFSISLISPQHIMSERLLFINYETASVTTSFITIQTNSQSLTKENTTNESSTFSLDGPLPQPPPIDIGLAYSEKPKFQLISYRVSSIFINNVYIIVLCFILSLLYSSGALFLIIFNASIWASTLASVVCLKMPDFTDASLMYITCNLGIISIHMIPEIGSYILAAIGGGVLSKAFTKESFWSSRFKRVLWDALILIFSSIVLILIAALLEVHVSASLFSKNVCVKQSVIYFIIGLAIIGTVIGLEIYRNKHHRNKY